MRNKLKRIQASPLMNRLANKKQFNLNKITKLYRNKKQNL